MSLTINPWILEDSTIHLWKEPLRYTQLTKRNYSKACIKIHLMCVQCEIIFMKSVVIQLLQIYLVPFLFTVK